MANPLKAAYAAACAGNVPPKAVSAPVAASAAPASGPPAQTVAPAAPPAVPGAKRDIAALRAKLAGGSNGGVNPPEAAAALTDDALEPRTVETQDGGAAAAPGWVEAKNGLVVRAPTTPEETPAASVAPTGELTRGQKAAATRAANKAAAQIQTTVFPPASTDAPVAAVVPSVGASDLARIADALERLVFLYENPSQRNGA